MVLPRIERAPRVKLRIIFLSSPARGDRERDMRRARTSRIVTQPDPVTIWLNLPRIGANVATEAEQQCKLKSPQSVVSQSQWYCLFDTF